MQRAGIGQTYTANHSSVFCISTTYYERLYYHDPAQLDSLLQKSPEFAKIFDASFYTTFSLLLMFLCFLGLLGFLRVFAGVSVEFLVIFRGFMGISTGFKAISTGCLLVFGDFRRVSGFLHGSRKVFLRFSVGFAVVF